MSMKKIYSCDICGNERIKMSALFGIHFSNMFDFTLGGFGCTEGKHLCYNCASQLKTHLNASEIEKALKEWEKQ